MLRRVRVERAENGAPLETESRPRRREAGDMGLPRVLHAQSITEPVSGVRHGYHVTLSDLFPQVRHGNVPLGLCGDARAS